MGPPAVTRDETVLWILAANFVLLSFMAVGGANTIVPEMHRQAVDVYGWMTTERFSDLFAVVQGAPGPNILLVTLIGWYVAGFPGAVVATVALVAPTSLLAYVVAGLWQRFRLAPLRIAIQSGLVPLTVGLVAASATVLARTSDTGPVALVLTLGTAAAILGSRIHPLVFMGLGAVLGLAGLV